MLNVWPELEPGGEDLFSYNLFTIAERDWPSFRELHIAYYQELRRLVAGSNPAERVVLVNLQLLRLDQQSEVPPLTAPRPGELALLMSSGT